MDVPSDEVRTHPDNLTGADVFDAPDTSPSPTEPGELVPWLRALPVGTVLLDKHQRAWQVGRTGRRASCLMLVNFASPFLLDNDSDMAQVCHSGPFRVLWSSGGGHRKDA